MPLTNWPWIEPEAHAALYGEFDWVAIQLRQAGCRGIQFQCGPNGPSMKGVRVMTPQGPQWLLLQKETWVINDAEDRVEQVEAFCESVV